ncbi:hypothetical protein [Pseudomonas glycinae]|uniref:hypothetical protein n=1 Tax=Pseudomonas glycinae TaxID=1785145 RepID=UPI001F437590|nr:hypothetical protein [Pseudomonas glycinae]
MTKDEQLQSVLDAGLTFRITKPRPGEVSKSDLNNVGGGISALLSLAIVFVFRREDNGDNTLLGTATTTLIPFPDPLDPEGGKIVAWTTPNLFWREGSHRIFAQYVVDGIGYNTPLQTFTVSQPLGLPVIANPGPKQIVHNRSVLVSGRLPENSTFIGVTVKVFLDQGQQPIGEDTPSTRFWKTSVELAPGAHSIVAQSFKGGASTGRTAPVLFYVAPSALTKVAFDLADDKSVRFSGDGDDGSTVRLSVVSGPGGVAPPDVQVNNGRWETTAENWPLGSYRMKAVQMISDSAGGWIESMPHNFEVDL